jgi:uncharacterized protein with von Willebrand factor type A (vWA) domain
MKTFYNTKTRKQITLPDVPELEVPEGYTDIKPLSGVRFQKFTGSEWVKDDEAEAEFRNFVEAFKIKKEINISDHRITKFIRKKFADEIDKLYPGETQQYDERIANIHELEGRE